MRDFHGVYIPGNNFVKESSQELLPQYSVAFKRSEEIQSIDDVGNVEEGKHVAACYGGFEKLNYLRVGRVHFMEVAKSDAEPGEREVVEVGSLL